MSQTFRNWECIVVDDGSLDATNELLEFYCGKEARIQYYKRELLPKGASHCRNLGLKIAKGDYCIFLDSDDKLLDFCIETRLKNSRLYPNRDFWVFPMFKDYGQKHLTKCKIPKKSDYLLDFLSCKLHWQTMCTFWDINFLRSIQGFNILYPRLNDPEIHIRAMIHSQLNYRVFWESNPDSVYKMTVSTIGPENSKKHFESLLLFIPDITSVLKENDLYHLVGYLKGYLNDYMRTAFRFNRRENNLVLFKVFYNNNILTLRQFSFLSSQYYIFLILDVLGKKVRKKITNLLEN